MQERTWVGKSWESASSQERTPLRPNHRRLFGEELAESLGGLTMTIRVPMTVCAIVKRSLPPGVQAPQTFCHVENGGPSGSEPCKNHFGHKKTFRSIFDAGLFRDDAPIVILYLLLCRY